MCDNIIVNLSKQNVKTSNKRVKNVYENKLIRFIRKQSLNKNHRSVVFCRFEVVYVRVRVCVCMKFSYFLFDVALVFLIPPFTNNFVCLAGNVFYFCCCVVSLPPRYSLIVLCLQKRKKEK